MGLVAYAAFVILIAWSAFRTNKPGWRSGLLFALLLATIPIWVGGMFWIFCLLTGQKMGIEGR